MRGDPGLGHPIHLPGPDLDFDPLADRPDDGRMQRLVHVGLGPTDVILELVVDGFPHGVDQAQGFVALGKRVQDDAEGDEIIDLLEAEVLGLHLRIDAEKIFAAAQNLGLQVRFLQFAQEGAPDGVDILLALGPGLGNEKFDAGVLFRVQVLE